MEAFAVIVLLILIIISLIIFAIMQIFAKKYNRMSPQEKIIFLHETEKMSNAFQKVPSMIWEDEYSKYRDVMDTYRDIRVDRWKESTKK